MDMMSPKSFAMAHKNMAWEELTAARIELEKEALKFKRERKSESQGLNLGIGQTGASPDAELVYEMNLEYLAELFKLTAEAYRRERRERNLRPSKEPTAADPRPQAKRPASTDDRTQDVKTRESASEEKKSCAKCRHSKVEGYYGGMAICSDYDPAKPLPEDGPKLKDMRSMSFSTMRDAHYF